MPPKFEFANEKEERIEKENARLWLSGLATVLKAEGIDINNPFDLARIKVRGHLQNAQEILDFNVETAEEEKAKEFVKAVDGRDFYAFMPVDENLKYEKGMEAGKSPIAWIKNNMLNPTELHQNREEKFANQAVFLYRMAKEGRLVIEDKNPPFYGDSNKFLLVGGSSSAVVSNDLSSLLAEVKNETKEAPDKVDVFAWNNIKIYAEDIYSIERKRDAVLKNIAQAAEKPDDKSVQEVLDSCQSDRKQRILCSLLSNHPKWAEDKKIVKTLESAVKIATLPVENRTKAQQKFLDAVPFFNDKYVTLENKLIETFGTKDFMSLMKSGKILDSEGKPYKAKNEYEFLSKVAKDVISNKGITINYLKEGVPATEFVALGGSDSFEPRVGKEYLNEFSRLIADVTKKIDPNYKENPEFQDIVEAMQAAEIGLKEAFEKSGSIGFQEFAETTQADTLFKQIEYFKDMAKDTGIISDKHFDMLKNLSRVQTLLQQGQDKQSHINNDTKAQIAEKLAFALAKTGLKSENPEVQEASMAMITNRAFLEEQVEKIMKTPAFLFAVDGKSEAELQKLLREDGVKLYKTVHNDYKKNSATKEGKQRKAYLEDKLALINISNSINAEKEEEKLSDPSNALRYTLAASFVHKNMLGLKLKKDDETLIQALAEDPKFKSFVKKLPLSEIKNISKDVDYFLEKNKESLNAIATSKVGKEVAKLEYAQVNHNNLMAKKAFFEKHIDEAGHFKPEALAHGEDKSTDARFSLNTSRQALQAMCIGYMLKEGKSLDDILDPIKGNEMRQQAGDIVMKNYQEMSDDDFEKFAIDCYAAGIDEMYKESEAVFTGKDPITPSSIYNTKNEKFQILAAFAIDFSQETEKLMKFSTDPVYKEKGKELVANQARMMGIITPIINLKKYGTELINKLKDNTQKKDNLDLGKLAIQNILSVKAAVNVANSLNANNQGSFTDIIKNLPIDSNTGVSKESMDINNFGTFAMAQAPGYELRKLGIVLQKPGMIENFVDMIAKDELPEGVTIDIEHGKVNGIDKLAEGIEKRAELLKQKSKTKTETKEIKNDEKKVEQVDVII